MLTTGHRKDQLCFPADRMIQGIICSRITGVKRYHHINGLIALITTNITDLKGQPVISILLRCFVAVGDHICLQIQSGDLHIPLLQFHQIIVEDESKIRFSASKIHDPYGLICGKSIDLIIDQFHKTVDLTVFVIHGADDLAFCRKDSHIHQRRNDGSFLQQIMFLPVVFCLCLRCLGGCHPLFTAGNFSLLRNADRMLPLSIPTAALTKCLFQRLFHKWSHLIGFQIFVKYLLLRILLRLPAIGLSVQHNFSVGSSLRLFFYSIT